MNRLADMRPGIANLDQAKTAFQEIAQLTCRLEHQKARVERQIADIKAKLAEISETDASNLHKLEVALTAFIQSHQDMFVHPRKIVTDFGSFGLQAVNEIVIEDQAKALAFLINNSLTDCYKMSPTLVKTAIKARFEAGQSIPGCTLKTGDTAVYKVAKTLVDEAKEKALE
jgi:hypothetical protein